jgi:MoaA/NifB/PqqE/SkfB family radical SAM enzyme
MITLSRDIGRNFCYAPWTNLHINPQGVYKLCCAGQVPIGNLITTPITEVLNSNKIIEIKQSILDNKYHKNCEICVNQEKHSDSSERDWYNDIAQNKPIELNTITETHLQNLDIRWSNTCNLSCVYCGDEASSQWASLKNLKPNRIDYSNTMPDILKFIEANKKTLKNLALLGGEPLLQKENEQLLDVIDKDIHINVITNLSVPLENNKIVKKLLEKNNVVWDISFETINEKFEYVRHGGSWELMTKNIRYLQEVAKEKPGHLIGITGQFSVYNALDLSKVNKFFYENNFPQPRWNELTYPVILSVANLPKHFIDKSVQELENSVQYIKWPKQQKFLLDIANNLKNLTVNTKDCKSLIDWHINQENTYWPNFKYKFVDLWPEYLE